MKKGHRRRKHKDVILLNDLAPRKEVKGGAAKRVFGEPFEVKPPSSTTPAIEKKAKKRSGSGSKN